MLLWCFDVYLLLVATQQHIRVLWSLASSSYQNAKMWTSVVWAPPSRHDLSTFELPDCDTGRPEAVSSEFLIEIHWKMNVRLIGNAFIWRQQLYKYYMRVHLVQKQSAAQDKTKPLIKKRHWTQCRDQDCSEWPSNMFTNVQTSALLPVGEIYILSMHFLLTNFKNVL